MDLRIEIHDRPGPGERPVEIVERKGLGHPDTICDAVAEHVCVRLCRHYLERFGTILHHNVDKALLCAGAARPAFGGGEVLEPIEIHLAGRATTEYRGERIPAAEIAVDACREWLRARLPEIDSDRHVRIVPHLRSGSAELTRLFARAGAVPLANDTSCGAGFAPTTDLERAVLGVERSLTAAGTRRLRPEIGADVKVMGVRRESRIDLTVGCAFVGRFVRDPVDYAAKKEAVRGRALEAARRETSLDVEVSVNAADDAEAGDVYLTVTGTSAESGDDGEVGRGNRASGLITPSRPMTLEATAGKNPVSHVGKLYNLAAGRIAARAAERHPEISDATCLLVSRIGAAIDDPQVADVRLRVPPARRRPGLEQAVERIVADELAGFPALRESLLREELTVY